MALSSPGSQKYDVFLNFRGQNVHNNFLGYLISALKHASLNIFVDYKLTRGEDIQTALMDAIQDSKIALAIFSKGYASSPWSLDELVKIMECKENPMLRQKVIPVFYHVTASEFRHQSGVFAQDFAKHGSDNESRTSVPRWRAAMAAAGCLSGRSVKKTSPEVDVVKQIVNDVLEILGRKPLEISSGNEALEHCPSRPVNCQPRPEHCESRSESCPPWPEHCHSRSKCCLPKPCDSRSECCPPSPEHCQSRSECCPPKLENCQSMSECCPPRPNHCQSRSEPCLGPPKPN